MGKALHAELQKARRRHDLLICLAVPVVVYLWAGAQAPTGADELANAYSALLYALPLLNAILMPIVMALIASRLWDMEVKGSTTKLLYTLQSRRSLFTGKALLGTGEVLLMVTLEMAVSSSISLLETVVTHFVDKAAEQGKGDKRKFYSFIASIAIAVLCVLVCMDGLGSNGISPANLLGQTGDAVRGWNDCWLDFFDMISEGVFMPLGGLLMTIMIGWELGPDIVKRECEATPGHKMSTYGFFKICVKFITPLCMVLILYGQIKSFFF